MSRREPLTPASLRERANLTQRQVAAALNKRVQTVSEWERGTRPKVYLSEVPLMCQVYQATLAELIEAFDRIDPSEL